MQITFETFQELHDFFFPFKITGTWWQIYCYQNTLYVGTSIDDTWIFKKHHFTGTAIDNPVSYSYEDLKLLNLAEATNFTLELVDSSCLNLTSKNQELIKFPLEQDTDLVTLLNEFDFFLDFAEIAHQDWDKLINKAHLALDFKISQSLDSFSHNPASLGLQFKYQSLFYEGLNPAQSFWGAMDAKLCGTAFLEQVEGQVSAVAIALTDLILDSNPIKIADDCINLKFETSQGLVITPSNPFLHRAIFTERKFQFLYSWDLKATTITELFKWLSSSNYLKLIANSKGLTIQQDEEQMVLSTDKFNQESELVIDFQSILIQDALISLTDKELQTLTLTIGKEKDSTDSSYVLSLSKDTETILSLSCLQQKKAFKLPQPTTNLDANNFTLDMCFAFPCRTIYNHQYKRDLIVRYLNGEDALLDELQKQQKEVIELITQLQTEKSQEDYVGSNKGFWEAHDLLQLEHESSLELLKTDLENRNIPINNYLFTVIAQVDSLKQYKINRKWWFQNLFTKA